MILKIIMVFYLTFVTWMCSALFNTVKDIEFSQKFTLMLYASIVLALAGVMVITIGVILEW